MLWYRKAIDYAESEKQESEIWALIMHIHTDRLIGASQKWKNKLLTGSSEQITYQVTTKSHQGQNY